MAARYLEKQGYRVARRNYRCPAGEMDLVVEGAEGIVFVEVRTKQRPCLFSPEETITRAKAMRLVRVAESFLVATGQQERPWRVDLVAVELDARGEPVRIDRFRDAISDLVG